MAKEFSPMLSGSWNPENSLQTKVIEVKVLRIDEFWIYFKKRGFPERMDMGCEERATTRFLS